MKLWPLNIEFDINISYPYTMDWPQLNIETIDGKFIGTWSLKNNSIIGIINELYIRFPESNFLKQLIKK